MPQIPIVLYSDEETSLPGVDRYERIADPTYSFTDKVRCIGKTPFARTVYLDTDIFVCAPLDDIFHLLDRFDIAYSYAPRRFSRIQGFSNCLFPVPEVPEAFAEPNTGVIAFRNEPAVLQIFRRWEDLYGGQLKAAGAKPGTDQPALRQAIYESDVHVHVLPPEYNFRTVFPQVAGMSVKILHGRDIKFDNACAQFNADPLDLRWLIPGEEIMSWNAYQKDAMQHDASPSLKSLPTPKSRLLVACHDIVLTGGLLRFDKVGTVLHAWGHEISYLVLSKFPSAQRSTALPVLSFDEARKMKWDAVMVPGAGFPDETIDKFKALRSRNFGVRIQHILNDQTRRSGFLKVNATLAPHVVIFNNDQWPPGSFTDFQADRFHILIGAVDTVVFRPAVYRSHPLTPGVWVVGGQASKNPEPLIEALNYLPPNVMLRLFGPDREELRERHENLIMDGRLELVGQLHGDELPRYYHGVDCVVMTETFAGWSNLAAEAMASGVPVLCTPHGTAVFAQHEEEALVMPTPTPIAIADGVQRLMSGPSLCRHLAERGREVICGYSWENYARNLLHLIQYDGRRHYSFAPDLGLYGKWPVKERLAGLEYLLDRTHGMTVADFGCAEGLVAEAFLQRGASCIHGFDLDAGRVDVALEISHARPDSCFRCADLSDWDVFKCSHGDVLKDAYDIILYLGIHHHLPAKKRLATLKGAVSLARRYLAIRTTPQLYESEAINAVVEVAGFIKIDSDDPSAPSHLGAVRIYERARS